MNTVVDPQQKMNAAFDNYFALSSMLQKDVSALLDGRNDTTQWKRNFIRASLPLIEGYAHCLREMCAVSFDCVTPPINAKEKDVILNEKKFGTSERIKLTIKTSYKLFDLSDLPDFCSSQWESATQAIEKRDLLMHPKRPIDLEISDTDWDKFYDGVVWLIAILSGIVAQLARKHIGEQALRTTQDDR